MGQGSEIFWAPHFDGRRYFNPFPTFEERGKADVLRWLIGHWLKRKANSGSKAKVLSEKDESWPLLLQRTTRAFSVTWIGHSTLLLEMNGTTILTDPIFSQRCSPFSFVGPKRVRPPQIAFEALPKIDLVVISHDHYDHLDKKTITRLGNTVLYLVPLGIGKILRTWGIERFVELDWGEMRTFNELEVICTPAQHFSGRTPFKQNHTLWAGWLLKSPSATVYFAGDSGYFPGFERIARSYGPIEYAALPIGAYEPRWFMKAVHEDPQDALQAFCDLEAKVFIPIHWGTFKLADESPDEPIRELAIGMRQRNMGKPIWPFDTGLKTEDR